MSGCNLSAVPDDLLRRRRDQRLIAWLAARHLRPTLWDLEAERRRRDLGAARPRPAA